MQTKLNHGAAKGGSLTTDGIAAVAAAVKDFGRMFGCWDERRFAGRPANMGAADMEHCTPAMAVNHEMAWAHARS